MSLQRGSLGVLEVFYQGSGTAFCCVWGLGGVGSVIQVLGLEVLCAFLDVKLSTTNTAMYNAGAG